MKVRVKAVKGRIAREAPNGSFIPDNHYVTVDKTPYMRRLIEVHGDVVVEPRKSSAKAPKPAPKEADQDLSKSTPVTSSEEEKK